MAWRLAVVTFAAVSVCSALEQACPSAGCEADLELSSLLQRKVTTDQQQRQTQGAKVQQIPGLDSLKDAASSILGDSAQGMLGKMLVSMASTVNQTLDQIRDQTARFAEEMKVSKADFQAGIVATLAKQFNVNDTALFADKDELALKVATAVQTAADTWDKVCATGQGLEANLGSALAAVRAEQLKKSAGRALKAANERCLAMAKKLRELQQSLPVRPPTPAQTVLVDETAAAAARWAERRAPRAAAPPPEADDEAEEADEQSAAAAEAAVDRWAAPKAPRAAVISPARAAAAEDEAAKADGEEAAETAEEDGEDEDEEAAAQGGEEAGEEPHGRRVEALAPEGEEQDFGAQGEDDEAGYLPTPVGKGEAPVPVEESVLEQEAGRGQFDSVFVQLPGGSPTEVCKSLNTTIRDALAQAEGFAGAFGSTFDELAASVSSSFQGQLTADDLGKVRSSFAEVSATAKDIANGVANGTTAILDSLQNGVGIAGFAAGVKSSAQAARAGAAALLALLAAAALAA